MQLVRSFIEEDEEPNREMNLHAELADLYSKQR